MAADISQLKLENQICFPLYSVSRIVIQQYTSILDELGLTYPQYLVLLVLWENEDIPVKGISEKLFLESNTLTPLLKRMEANGFIRRSRSKIDERMVIISLTPKGKDMQQQAIAIPDKLMNKLDCLSIDQEDLPALKRILDKILSSTNKID